MLYERIETPVGILTAQIDGGAIRRLGVFEAGVSDPSGEERALGEELREQLGEYFRGERESFSLPLSLSGTEFQRRVWAEIEKNPFGETCSYGEIARRIGHPGASRAVGSACRANPVLLLVPCHRVTAAGRRGGYVLGADAKEYLLTLEGRRGG